MPMSNIEKDVLEALEKADKDTNEKLSVDIWSKFESITFTKEGVKFQPKEDMPPEDEEKKPPMEKKEDEDKAEEKPEKAETEPEPSKVEAEVAELKAQMSKMTELLEKMQEMPKKEDEKPPEDDEEEKAESKAPQGKPGKADFTKDIGLKEVGYLIGKSHRKEA